MVVVGVVVERRIEGRAELSQVKRLWCSERRFDPLILAQQPVFVWSSLRELHHHCISQRIRRNNVP